MNRVDFPSNEADNLQNYLLKINHQGKELMIITPGSPMGKGLPGKSIGDSVVIGAGNKRTEYEIVKVS